MVLLKRKRVMAAKVETTPGTAESLTASEGAFNAYDLMIQPTISVETREAQGSFNKLSGVPGARSGTATFKTDLGWDGTATVPSWASVLLPGCGWVDSSGTFTPRSEAPGSNVKTLTIAGYVDGVFKVLAGCVGTFRLVCPAGRMAFIEWTFTGVFNSAPTDVALIAPTYPTALPIRYASATTTFNSIALRCENVTFDAGNEITLLESGATAAGYVHAVAADRSPTITCNPEAVTVATQDRFTAWITPSEYEFSVLLDGPSNSTVEVVAPKAQISNLQEGDRGKVVTDELTFTCNKDGATADQELQFIFTETV